jgi:septal ring factor EnvC (AmiA/AmiB activator)
MRIAGAVIVVLLLLLTASGVLLRSAYKEIGELGTALTAARAETEKANETIKALEIQHARQVEKMESLQKETRDATTQLRRQSQQIRAGETRLRQALEREPQRAACAVAVLDRRSLREVCRASGGSPADCKIDVPESCSTGSGDTSDDSASADPVVDEPRPSGGGPAVHPKSRLGQY